MNPGGHTGSLMKFHKKKKKKKERKEKKLKMFQQNPLREHSSWVPLPSLPPPQLLWPQWLLGPGGHLGFTRNSSGRGSEESGMLCVTSG